MKWEHGAAATKLFIRAPVVHSRYACTQSKQGVLHDMPIEIVLWWEVQLEDCDILTSLGGGVATALRQGSASLNSNDSIAGPWTETNPDNWRNVPNFDSADAHMMHGSTVTYLHENIHFNECAYRETQSAAVTQ